MNENDKKSLLEDFKKADKSKKLDMWFFAIEQEALWEDILTELSAIAQGQQPMKGAMIEE